MIDGFTHPNAMQRIAQKMEEEVWPIDRAFFNTHPDRNYWLRRTLPIEIAEVEAAQGTVAAIPAGHQFCTAIMQIAPGVLLRLLLSKDAASGDPPVELSEAICRSHFEFAFNACDRKLQEQMAEFCQDVVHGVLAKALTEPPTKSSGQHK